MWKRDIVAAAVIISLAAGITWAGTIAQTEQVATGGDLTQRATRACIFPVDGWTIVDCSNAAAAQSALLTTWTRYVVQCGDDSYFTMGDAATDKADSSDGWIPSGAWLELMTDGGPSYFSCLNKNVDSDCRYYGCK